ncbi:hypothetical protein DL767_010374 [Monosporascus sp. MG133]|nr:hypothetical protein DL767_010374 [Monosporascus sp. MG133]
MQTSSLTPTPGSISATQVRTGKYRRNGQLQSCEPCRKSKLRCDHIVPICQRCIRRRRGNQCVYLSTPLAKSRRSPRAELPTPSTITGDGGSPDIVQSVETGRTSTVHGATANEASTCGNAVQRHRAASAPPLNARCEPPSSQNPGFLGVTSYSSIFADLGNLGVVPSNAESSQVRYVMVSHHRMTESCEVLSFLKDRSTLNRFVSRIFKAAGGSSNMCLEPIMKRWLLKLSIHHGDVLKAQEPGRIRRMCELIWRNTRSPLIFDGSISPLDWACLGTGPNLRWEVVGCIAAVTGICAASLDPSDSLLAETGVTGIDFARRMLDLADACLGFCRDCQSMNDMFLCATGAENNTVIMMGLHQGIEANDKVPFFLAEQRKRALSGIYSSEVGLAAFLGRPPRLSYRHITLELPLDLSEAQLMLGRDEIAAVTANLDKDGFSQVGRMERVTWLRAWVRFACRREDILDLAFGQHTPEEVLHRAKLIQDMTEEQWAGLPPFIQRVRDESMDPSRLKPLEKLFHFYICQGLRSNELLLQRVLIRKTGAGSTKLIQTARAIFKDVLHLTQRVDVSSCFMMDVNSILVIHGLRSAAIIAVELLKQEQLPHPDSALLPRSQTIQELSVFAARLGAVDPRDGSFAICDQGRKVITRILDKILSPQHAGDRVRADRHPQQLDRPQQNIEQFSVSGTSGETLRNPGPTVDASTTATGDIDFGFDTPYLGHDGDFMQWLEHVDWDRPEPWMAL